MPSGTPLTKHGLFYGEALPSRRAFTQPRFRPLAKALAALLGRPGRSFGGPGLGYATLGELLSGYGVSRGTTGNCGPRNALSVGAMTW